MVSIRTTEITESELFDLLLNAAMGFNLTCPYCEYQPLEPDYEKCPECYNINPLRANGMI